MSRQLPCSGRAGAVRIFHSRLLQCSRTTEHGPYLPAGGLWNSNCNADTNSNPNCHTQSHATASSDPAASPQCASHSKRDVKTYGRLHYSTFASYPNSEASRDAASTPNPAAVAVSDTSYSC